MRVTYSNSISVSLPDILTLSEKKSAIQIGHVLMEAGRRPIWEGIELHRILKGGRQKEIKIQQHQNTLLERGPCRFVGSLFTAPITSNYISLIIDKFNFELLLVVVMQSLIV